ncbi:acyl-protein thioesterase 2-like [Corticium candelabrum]|uniref:acyl-protein thioesterase 2-like n=1 Tax=Corticium candelabrum TaxID=121492 RepID=UPI002E256B3F|nr:acyl-protein thioesterase 2-like [Corticium candelabrum]
MSWKLVTVEAKAKHTATVVFLHGLGDTGHGWSSNLEAILDPHVKLICPTANNMPVSINFGMRMPSWFDIFGLSDDAKEDTAGVHRAAKELQALIENEVKSGIPSSRIILGGFSQGGALSLYTALTMDLPLSGVLALSSWLPLHKELPGAVKGNQHVPMLQCHGDADFVVPFMWGQKTAEFLSAMNPNHKFKTYRGLQHSSSPEELEEVRAFIKQHLPSDSK